MSKPECPSCGFFVEDCDCESVDIAYCADREIKKLEAALKDSDSRVDSMQKDYELQHQLATEFNERATELEAALIIVRAAWKEWQKARLCGLVYRQSLNGAAPDHIIEALDNACEKVVSEALKRK